MSQAITKSEFFGIAKSCCTPRQFEQLLRMVEFIESSTCLSLSYTKAKTHHTVTASFVRSDGRRFKVFSCYEDGKAMCQHTVALPDDLSDEQRSAIEIAYRAYRDSTGGEAGTSWGWFSISSTTLSVLTDAIGEIASVLSGVLEPILDGEE